MHQSERARIFTRETTAAVVQRILGFCAPEGGVQITVSGWWNSELKWARNRPWVATDRRDVRIKITRGLHGGSGEVVANQIDDESLQAAVRAAERIAARRITRIGKSGDMPVDPPVRTTPNTAIWSDATYSATAEDSSRVARTLIANAESEGMQSAGYLEMRAGMWASSETQISNADFGLVYHAYTQAQCSMTVRHPQGLGSGWAGLSSYDWSAIDSQRLADVALRKCLASLNPVRIEPGRYTVILEAQAVYDLVSIMMHSFDRYNDAEKGKGPWALEFDVNYMIWRTKLGMKVMDERITISHAPGDPQLGVLPWPGMDSITWIRQGILQSLEYGSLYPPSRLGELTDARGRPAFRMSGGETSLEEMLTSTKRGLLVTRFSGIANLDSKSLLSTGVTRDGLWLVENGKISKSVHNMRFTESPLFVLNQVESLGIPEPIFHPTGGAYEVGVQPAIVPPLKSNDFSFTSLVDAV